MWVLIYLGIALAGLVMVGCFAVWLWRKAVALLREAGVLLGLADELAGLAAQIGQPPEPEHPDADDLAMGSTPRQAT